ncbi:MAG: flagellar type III secretion system pore protein FliP [Defluviitaleaceae bacterium]|nr:flagellar type III secretion system pore protein FliP [Defluviitaleaceae bacterium]
MGVLSKIGIAALVFFGIVHGLQTEIGAIELTMTTLDNPEQVVPTLQVFLMLTLIGMAPFLLLMLTSFTRIIISLSFIRSALGTQQMPPNQVLIGMALFLTLFIMGPIFTEINDTAITPFGQGQMGQEEALEVAMEPLREFMWRQVEPRDLELFIRLSGETFETMEDIPNRVLIPAFMLGELTKGFRIGFMIFMPFIVIDMIVASVLMAMGMMMLPPAMISLPFKVLLFVMVDGWSLLMESILLTFR